MGRLHPDLVEMMAENGHLLKKDQNTSDFLPNEISRPKAVHSLALLKSAQLEQEWLHTYGFQKRRLFFSHGDSSSDTSFVSSTQTSACASPSPIKECSVSNSSYETTLDSKNTTKTDRNIPIASTNNFSKGTTDTTKCTKLPNGTWYKKFKEGKLDELYPREETFLCGGVSDWTQELKSVRRIALNKSRENQFSFKLKKKRVSLLEARAKRFAGKNCT
jgi:hypothetical protein